jgi:hypothetical protein
MGTGTKQFFIHEVYTTSNFYIAASMLPSGQTSWNTATISGFVLKKSSKSSPKIQRNGYLENPHRKKI